MDDSLLSCLWLPRMVSVCTLGSFLHLLLMRIVLGRKSSLLGAPEAGLEKRKNGKAN